VRIVQRAAEMGTVPFTVLEGLRTIERQRELYAAKATKTLNSRHIKAANGFGHAVDLAPLLNGKITWDWPLYHQLAKVVKAAAKAEKVALEWGGDWKTFKDGPHWQLPWAQYPGK
jgi:peptidoglycan LD-endopeptidase CwlK